MPDRSGTEPATARSPLRLRMVLAAFGIVVCSAFAIWAWSSRSDFDEAAMTVLAALGMVGVVVGVVDLVVVARRWQGHVRPHA